MKTKKRKGIYVLLAGLMVLQLLHLAPAEAAGPTNDNLTNQSQYLKIHTTSDTPASSLLITQSDGITVIAPNASGNYENIPAGALISLTCAFHLEDGDEDAGVFYDYAGTNYFTLNVPQGIHFSNPVGGEIVATDSIYGPWHMADWSLDAGTNVVTVEFTDNIENDQYKQREAQFTLTGTFEDVYSGDPAGETQIQFGSQIVTIKRTISPDPTVELTKTGTYDAAANTITWEVVVTPPSGTNLGGYQLVDQYGSGQSYVAGSFAVDNGTGFQSVADTALGNPDTGTTPFTYTFPSGAGDGVQRIRYKTAPGDFSGETGPGAPASEFLNTATVKDATGTIQATKQAQVSLDWISKSGMKVTSDGVVQWTVTVTVPGQAGTSVSGAQIVDALSANLVLDTSRPV